ncbi:MAG: glycosyltransferase family 4 protein [Nonlabens sp.]
MKILFLSLVKLESLEQRGIYSDLLRELVNRGHHITAVTPLERRDKKRTKITRSSNFVNLQVRTLNIQKVNVLEKGMGMVLLSKQFYRAMKKHQAHTDYDLILYSTPPITLYELIARIKKQTKAATYLLLKDIFPQNAVDMGMMRKGGLLHSYFSSIEKKLYQISDHIGCMSPANVEFIKKHHPYISISKIHVNPNSIEPLYEIESSIDKYGLRAKYGLPQNKLLLVYGGNLGKPQGIEFLVEILEKYKGNQVHFLIVGGGLQYEQLKRWFKQADPSYATLINTLPKLEYDLLLSACDVGLIFLSENFTIPNYPSRLLSYLEMGMPVISSTDVNTDVGVVLEDWECGYNITSGDHKSFFESLEILVNDEGLRDLYSSNARKLLLSQFTVERSVDILEGTVDRVKHV